MFGRIGKEPGGTAIAKARFLAEVMEGSLYVGSPETVARKIAATVGDLGLARFDMKYTTDPIKHSHLIECPHLYGQPVVPTVRDRLASATAYRKRAKSRLRPAHNHATSKSA